MIETVENYPLPFSEDEIVELQKDLHMLSEDDIIKCVDTFHDKYINEMTRTSELSVFKCMLPGNPYIYFWCHASEFGFRVEESWEVMCGFVELLDEFTEQYSSEDFEPTYYPWELP